MADWNEALFQGIAQLYGAAAVARFRNARVGVIGLGGVGSWTAEALARSGVGELLLMDLDDVCVSNTNRQLHATHDTIGRFKVSVMAERCRAINPAIRIDEKCQFLTPDNLPTAGLESLDYVVDAIDSVVPKVALIPWLKAQGVPFVMTGGAGGQTDPTRIGRCDLARTVQDPLAAAVRRQLRRQYGFARGGHSMGVPCVSSDEPLHYPAAAARADNARLNCAAGLGASVVVTASFGFAAAGAALDCLARDAGAVRG